MKHFASAMINALLLLLFVIGTSCSRSESEQNEDLAGQAFDAMAEGKAAQYLLLTEEEQAVASRPPRYRSYFHVQDVQVHVSESEPDTIHYECTVPGPVGVAFCIATARYYLLNDQFSRRIPISGYLRVITDDDGRRCIVPTDKSNPFALYLALQRIGDNDFTVTGTVNPQGDYQSDSAFVAALSAATVAVSDAYGRIIPGWVEGDTLKSELENYVANFGEILRSASPNLPPLPSARSGLLNRWPWLKSKQFIFWAVVVALLIIAGVVKGAYYLGVKINNRVQEHRRARQFSAYGSLFHIPQNTLTLALSCTVGAFDWDVMQPKHNQHAGETPDLGILEKAILFTFRPAVFRREMVNLCRNLEKKPADNAKAMSAGWCACALGRCLTRGLSPHKVQTHRKRFDRLQKRFQKEVDHYVAVRDELVGLRQANIQDLISNTKDTKRRNSRIKKLQTKLQKLEKTLRDGPVVRAVRRGVRPITYLEKMACDMHSHSKFEQQGAMMGLLPFLIKHSRHKQVSPVLENVVKARNEMISSDSEMSFFEVRVPTYCTKEGYGVALGEVLRCANPSMTFADTNQIMELATAEIPGVLSLLTHYPLRIIDPGNREKEGFYKFTPFRHALWTQYVPPKDEGQVIRRYHEVLDMTLPNSTGLNLRLFTSPYDVIPVLFHEYCHHMEDNNEASVFLRTHMFCQYFYRKYRAADPKKNFAFVYLQNLLGTTPDPEKYDKLNNLILTYYGEQEPEHVAEKKTDLMVDEMNKQILMFNQTNRWCPDKTFPLLTNEGDKTSLDTIRSASIRAATAPRRITQQEFNERLENWRPQ